MNNLILWTGLIIAFILLIHFYLKKREQNKIKLEKKKKTSYALDKNEMENFIVEAFRHLNMNDNLIENGSFDHGDDLTGLIKKSDSGNEILSYSNPTPYNYVLQQKVSPVSDLEKVFYTIELNIVPNFTYLLEYVDFTNSKDDTGISVYTKNNAGDTLNIQTKQVIKEVMNYNNQKWVLINQIFTIPQESNGKLIISFETEKNSEETVFRYLAHLYLRKYLSLAPNFELTRYLQVYLNTTANSLQINQNFWKNLAGNNGNMKIVGNTKMVNNGLYTRDLKMSTLNANSLNINPLNNNNDFSIIFDLGSLPVDFINNNDEEEYHSLVIYGNQVYGLAIQIPNKYGPIKLIVADEEFTTDKSIEPNIGPTISFVYTNKTLEIYINQILLQKIKTKQIYFNKEDIILNSTGNWTANLKSLLIYNNALLQENIVKIVNWFQNNNNVYSNSAADNQSNTTASTHGLTMSTCLGDDCGCSSISDSWAYTSNADPKYNEKLNNLRKCYLNKLKCPTAQYVSGEYKVTIPEKSLYAMEYNSYGVKNYGSNQAKARELYTENFPMCLIPDVLSNSHKSTDTSDCPYIIEKENPCKTKACEGVKWGKTKLMDLSQECKNAINQYCKANWDKDPSCLCWNPKYQNEGGCLAFMDHMKDPKDVQIKEVQKPCCLTDYPITDHPEIGKYIKKDEIPCWGCKL